jgi:hypothetical protein
MAERDTNTSRYNSKNSLINSIIKVFSNFPWEELKRACSWLGSRLEEVVASEGNLIR